MVQRNISLDPELDQYLRDMHISVSKFLQDKIREEIIKEGKADKYLKEKKKK